MTSKENKREQDTTNIYNYTNDSDFNKVKGKFSSKFIENYRRNYLISQIFLVSINKVKC